jgi:predicted enzyme related to lactoylglutathione lyase
MLAEHPIDVMLLATDLATAKDFYGATLGLEVLTKASWRVGDVAAAVADLRSRGVQVIDYDLPSLKTVDGVADVGFALTAWFVDPSGNTIGLMQFKDPSSG